MNYRRTRALLVACVIAIAVAVPLSPSRVGAATPLPPGQATSLSSAFQTSSANFLQALLCPVGKKVKQVTSTIPGVNTLTDQLANVLCALSVLGYAYRTTYYPASGPPQVRYFRALAAVPVALDVDGNGSPDFTGLLSPTLVIPGAQLTITRLNLPATARVKIEAVLLDPSSTTTFVGIGEDGSAVGTAKNWRINVGAFLTFGTAVDLQLSLVTSQPPASLAALGEVFFGSNPDAPTSIDRGTMSFAPVPANFTTRLRIGPSSEDGTVTSTVRCVLTVNVQAISSGAEKDVTVVVNQLPTSMDVMHQSSGGHDVFTYHASAAISHLSGAYHDYSGTNLLTAAQLDVTSLPSTLTVDESDAKTVLNVPSGVIGAVEARFATGQDVSASPAGTTPYVSFHRYDGTHLSGGLRLANIKSVSFDSTGPYVGDIVFGTAPGLIPLSFIDDITGISATGHLSNLPAHITVTIDLPNGKIVFDGHGQGIAEIGVSATDSQHAFFAKATRVDLTVDALPALDTIDFKQDTGTVTFTPSAPIGSVSLLASDGADAPAVTGDYASYEDTPSLWRAFVQIVGITKLSFTPSPLAGTIETSSPQLMTLFAELATTGTDDKFNGTIDKLPSQIDFSLTTDTAGDSVLDYNSHGQVINKISVDANGLSLAFGADTLHAEIDHLPSHLTVTIPAPYGTAVFDPHHDYVGRVLVQVYPHAKGAKNPAGTDQMVFADSSTGQFTADIHNIGYNSFYTSSPAVLLTYDIGSDPLEVHIGDGTTYFDSIISNPEPASIIGSTQERTDLTYTVNQFSPNYSGDGSIDSIYIATNTGGSYLGATLQHIAPKVHICVSGGDGCRPSGGWVSSQVLDGGPVFGVAPNFEFQLQPTDFLDHDWPTRMQLDGIFCPGEANVATCEDSSQKKERIVISALQFGTVEAGFGNTTDDCGYSSVLCGRAFAYFNTDDTHITGDVKYFQSGDDSDGPFVEYRADDPANYVTASDWFVYDSYDIPSEDHQSTGSARCGGSPKLNVTFLDTTFDFLSGDFGICPH